MRKFKSATKEQFNCFVSAYGAKLERDVYAVCEPPLVTYNDFSLGHWPTSVVARARLRDGELTDFEVETYET